MTPKERVVSQIEHRESDFVPYELYFDEEFDTARLDAHFGSNDWRRRLDCHIIFNACLDNIFGDWELANKTGENVARDPFGRLWRFDMLPFHLAKPALDRPSLAGYEFPDLSRGGATVKNTIFMGCSI